MFSFDEDCWGYTIYKDGKPLFDIGLFDDLEPTDETRGMVSEMVDALNKESVGKV